jgi:hypothetical protein
MEILLCPINSCTVRISTPALTSLLANVWRGQRQENLLYLGLFEGGLKPVARSGQRFIFQIADQLASTVPTLFETLQSIDRSRVKRYVAYLTVL